MKLIAQVKLQPDERQADALKRTLETANAACNWLSERAWQAQTFRQYDLHKLAYHAAREAFPSLSSQVVVRCVSKVADAYKLDRKTQRTFKATGGIAYDDRILRWYVDKGEVSIWTVGGRLRLPFVCGERQRELLKTQQGESDLVLVKGHWFLLAVCNVEEPTPREVEGVLGVDLGVVNIAVDSDGEMHSASHVNNVRYRHRRLRRKLQKRGTRSAKRRLKKLAGQERRFATNVNHVLSKRIVAKAVDTRRAIALEDLGGIRERVTVRKPQRATLHSWSFFQLRGFISYKAQRAGVPVLLVDPRNTSRACYVCGCIDKANRKSQDRFLCVSCGHSDNADTNAALNIRRRGEVNRPNVAPPSAAVTSRPL